jgi:hypothetical protein
LCLWLCFNQPLSHAFDTFNAVIDAHLRPSDRARLPRHEE